MTEDDRIGNGPQPITEYWPCQGCGEMVGVPAIAREWLAQFNRHLRKRREEPISTRDVMWCVTCTKAHRAEREREYGAEVAARTPAPTGGRFK